MLEPELKMLPFLLSFLLPPGVEVPRRRSCAFQQDGAHALMMAGALSAATGIPWQGGGALAPAAKGSGKGGKGGTKRCLRCTKLYGQDILKKDKHTCAEFDSSIQLFKDWQALQNGEAPPDELNLGASAPPGALSPVLPPGLSTGMSSGMPSGMSPGMSPGLSMSTGLSPVPASSGMSPIPALHGVSPQHGVPPQHSVPAAGQGVPA